MNKVLKIDEKNERITVQAESEVIAEKLAYKTHVFTQAHECEMGDIQKEKDGTYTIFYVMYIDYDSDFMDDDW